MRVDEIPVAFTPSGGWTPEMPPPVLANCETPLADGEVQPNHPSLGGVQRIEQAGDRATDVAEFDKQTPITVVATFEDGVQILRPVGIPTEVRRRLDGEQLIWDYIGFTARLDGVD